MNDDLPQRLRDWLAPNNDWIDTTELREVILEAADALDRLRKQITLNAESWRQAQITNGVLQSECDRLRTERDTMKAVVVHHCGVKAADDVLAALDAKP